MEDFNKEKRKNSKSLINIIIPAYNEEERIGNTIEKIVEFCFRNKYLFNLIIVNDASTDNTVNIVEGYKNEYKNNVEIFLLHNEKNMGKGMSIKKGMLFSKGDIAIFSDADLSVPIEELEKLTDSLEHRNYDIAIGSRNIKGANRVIPQGKIRSWMGKIFSYIVRIIILPNIMDSQCGFKAFKRECIKPIFEAQTINDFGFDPEIIYIAFQKGYRVEEIPVIWENDAMSKVNVFRDPVKMIFDLIVLRIRAWINYYRKK